MDGLQTKLLSSLEKVFLDEEPMGPGPGRATVLTNEAYGFQWALQSKNHKLDEVYVEVTGPLADWAAVRAVSVVPVEYAVQIDHDGFVLRDRPGLFPDRLDPIPCHGLKLLPGQWRSVWISLEPKKLLPAGVHEVGVQLKDREDFVLAEDKLTIEVIDAELPAQRLIHTQWLHCDCLASYYGLDVFSDEHWERIEQFIETAVDHGINMILTPIFTPPLDTAVGAERPTVQLVDVEKRGDEYQFDFKRLKQWVQICRRLGVEYFEFAHLFTQWGAKHAPKIVAMEDGAETRIFGWDTDAGGPEYAGFLDQFLPALIDFIRAEGLEKNSYFHVSDEPRPEHMESYGRASSILKRHLTDFPIMDALSDFSFYETGLVEKPIPANNHIEPFLEAGVEGLWTYYCVSQYKQVAQRFMSMPSQRSRILGWQLYKFAVEGFLHWGYNFYYSQYSRQLINPFYITDGLAFAPAGDTFLVYPGQDGPLESIRIKVLREALQDLRALELLQSLAGRETVMELMERDLDQPLTFSQYPQEAQWLLQKRQAVNEEIVKRM